MDWFEGQFLPSLVDKYENRDPQYRSVFITEKQANVCRRYMNNEGGGRFTYESGDKVFVLKERDNGSTVFYVKE